MPPSYASYKAYRLPKEDKGTKLVEKHQKVLEYFDGDLREACTKAGYKNVPKAMRDINKHPLMIERLQQREADDPLIANRIERMRFLTSVMRDEGEKMSQRLNSAEMLAKMNGDFLIKHEVKTSDEDLIREGIKDAAIEVFMERMKQFQLTDETFDSNIIDMQPEEVNNFAN
jgi:hypothetical protein